MERLPEKLKKNGLDYKLVKRNDFKAMYTQMEGGHITGYEVFRINVQLASSGKIAGKVIDRAHKELFPCNEAFGSTAWSYMKRENADDCYNGLEEIKKREKDD